MDNQEIDRQIAEKVMGWKFIRKFEERLEFQGIIAESFLFQKPCGIQIDVPVVFDPSIDIACAFEVVEKMKELNFKVNIDNIGCEKDWGWYCKFRNFSKGISRAKHADTPEMAICLAALEAVGGAS